MEVEQLIASEIMSQPLFVASPEESLINIVNIMAEQRISAVILETQDAGNAFIITSGDIIRWLSRHPEESVAKVLAGDLMHGPVTPIMENDSISTAIHVMCTHGFKRVVVKDNQDQFVGILTLKDILKWNFAVFRPATPFMLFTTVKDSGLVVFQYQFPTSGELSLLDADLFGSSMTAISILIGELLKERSDLKVIRKQNFVIMLEEKTYLKALLIADNESIDLRKHLMDFIAEVEETHSKVLEKYCPTYAPRLNNAAMQSCVEKYFARYLQEIYDEYNPNDKSGVIEE